MRDRAGQFLQHRSVDLASRSPDRTRVGPSAYSSAPGKLPITPASTNRNDSRNASVGRDTKRSQTSRPCVPCGRPKPPSDSGSRMIRMFKRHENPIVAEGQRDAEARSDHPRQRDADRLHGQRERADEPQVIVDAGDRRASASDRRRIVLINQPPSPRRREQSIDDAIGIERGDSADDEQDRHDQRELAQLVRHGGKRRQDADASRDADGEQPEPSIDDDAGDGGADLAGLPARPGTRARRRRRRRPAGSCRETQLTKKMRAS